ncbi:MAG: GNAT family N-acetyltransferase [Thermoclostridium sp.]|nr:GNAT family N-acetyltransferase [Thermoclostridium sp.]
MIYIPNADFSKCTNLLYSDSPSYSGILAGECKGDVWVHQLENPELAMVYSNSVGGFSILGEPKNHSVYDDFHQFLREVFFAELINKGFGGFEFSVESPIAEKYLLNLFSDKRIHQEDEYFFRSSAGGRLQAMYEYSIVRVDADFIDRLSASEFDHPEMVTDRILQSWETYEQFFKRSLAFAAVSGKSIAAVIAGTARYQNIIPIDIETREEHRRKGLANALTKYFVNACMENGLTAQWNCVDSNIASRKTAIKAGFQFLKKRPFYWFAI